MDACEELRLYTRPPVSWHRQLSSQQQAAACLGMLTCPTAQAESAQSLACSSLCLLVPEQRTMLIKTKPAGPAESHSVLRCSGRGAGSLAVSAPTTCTCGERSTAGAKAKSPAPGQWWRSALGPHMLLCSGKRAVKHDMACGLAKQCSTGLHRPQLTA